MTEENYKYDVFISYSRADYVDENDEIISGNVISIIKDFLDLSNISYWIDENGNYTGKEFMDVITRSIENSSTVLFISSINSNKSDWVKREVIVANDMKKKIIPFRIDNTRYNSSILMLLAGVDYIDYVKNNQKALLKLKRVLKGEDTEIVEKEIIPIIPPKTSLYNKLKGIGIIILVLLGVFAVFSTIGFSIGYYSSRENVDEMMTNAFRNGRIVAINHHTVQYNGEKIKFTYNIDEDKILAPQNNVNFFRNVTFESVMMSVSMPVAFRNLFKSSRYVGGNGKIKAGYLIAGSIGIICGYSIGKPIGKDYAIWKNERDLNNYFELPETKLMVKQKLSVIFQ